MSFQLFSSTFLILRNILKFSLCRFYTFRVKYIPKWLKNVFLSTSMSSIFYWLCGLLISVCYFISCYHTELFHCLSNFCHLILGFSSYYHIILKKWHSTLTPIQMFRVEFPCLSASTHWTVVKMVDILALLDFDGNATDASPLRCWLWGLASGICRHISLLSCFLLRMKDNFCQKLFQDLWIIIVGYLMWVCFRWYFYSDYYFVVIWALLQSSVDLSGLP